MSATNLESIEATYFGHGVDGGAPVTVNLKSGSDAELRAFHAALVRELTTQSAKSEVIVVTESATLDGNPTTKFQYQFSADDGKRLRDAIAQELDLRPTP